MASEYIHDAGVDNIVAMVRGGVTYYYHKDALGSVTAITDNAGLVVKTYAYKTFGTISETTGTLENPYTYTGREYDSETGLYYYRARYYDSALGRFIQKDPIGLAGGMNVYSYVGNNSVNYVDPWGLALNDIVANWETNTSYLFDLLRLPSATSIGLAIYNRTVSEGNLFSTAYITDNSAIETHYDNETLSTTWWGVTGYVGGSRNCNETYIHKNRIKNNYSSFPYYSNSNRISMQDHNLDALAWSVATLVHELEEANRTFNSVFAGPDDNAAWTEFSRNHQPNYDHDTLHDIYGRLVIEMTHKEIVEFLIIQGYK